MNAILLTMPALVYVAAVSGAIHMANYYRDTAREQGQKGAPGRAVLHAALPICLATGTTAFGLATLCYSELVPIQLFGLYSAGGVQLGLPAIPQIGLADVQGWLKTARRFAANG